MGWGQVGVWPMCVCVVKVWPVCVSVCGLSVCGCYMGGWSSGSVVKWVGGQSGWVVNVCRGSK